MADLLTSKYSLFLPPQGYNSGDLGKSLNDNFVILDQILWDIRTNYADNPQTNVPLGAFAFDKVSDQLYIKVSTGLQLVGAGVIGTPGASGEGGGFVFDTAMLLASLFGAITEDQLAFELGSRIDLIDQNIADAVSAKNAAVQAKLDALQAKSDAITAANQAAGYKTDAYNYSQDAKTQADSAAVSANTASTKASEAASSAGSAGASASAAESSKIQAGVFKDSAQSAATATAQDKTTVLAYKTAAETAASTAQSYAIQAQIGASGASGYANAAFSSQQAAMGYSNQAGSYAIAAQSASGLAANYAGQAQSFAILSMQASGLAQSAMQAAGLSATNASGYANQAQMFSVDASGYAQAARYQAELAAASASGTSAQITELQEAIATETSARTTAIQQLSNTVDENTATLQTQAEVIDGIGATYSVKVDNNGVLSGYGLTSVMASGGEVTSEFAILADKFKVVAPGDGPYDGQQIFVVDAERGIIGISGAVIIGMDPNTGAGGIPAGQAVEQNYSVVVESTNGEYFKPGETMTTTLIAHVFQGDTEVTDTIDASRFRWRRVSFYPLPPPLDDDTWNSIYVAGYKQILITANSVESRATFHCDIMSA